MGETLLYSQRLHGITEKRRILTEIDTIQRELEQQKLKLQQLKRKSLRDRWLMDGLPASPGAEIENPFSETEDRIHQLQEELDRLQSQLVHLENPGESQPKIEKGKNPVPHTQLVNGERQATEENKSSEEQKEGPEESFVGFQREKQNGNIPSTDSDSKLSIEITTGHPIPAPRGKKIEASKQNEITQSHNQEAPNKKSENLDILQGPQDQAVQNIKNINLKAEHQNQTAEELHQNHENQNLGHVVNLGSQEHNTIYSNTLSSADQNENVLNKIFNQNSDSILEESKIEEENQTQEANVKEVHYKQQPIPILREEKNNQEPISTNQDDSQGKNQDQNQDESHESQSDDQNRNPQPNTETLLETQDKNHDQKQYENKESPLQTVENNQDQDYKQDQSLIHEDQTHETLPVTEDLNKNLDHGQELPPVTHDKKEGQREASLDVPLDNENQTLELMPVTEDQKQSYDSSSQDQNSLPTTQDQSQYQNQKQEFTSLINENNHSSILLSKDQNHDQLSTLLDQKQEFFKDQEQNQSSILPCREEKQVAQVHISQVVVVATTPPKLDQHSFTNQQGSSANAEIGTTAGGNSSPESQPLLHKPEVTKPSSAHGTNTAETRNEKIRTKEKTCQCCVVM
ncbi:paralemmin-3 [Bombina bombina]|uniref:paralemmin-3 n=1 Tax=Bombina bombina TaxID=8345 RepID=UPI00235AF7A1|nr:paralemmin-3 [Bombina bombina]